jgi:peptide/nickel transport system substrate-binding protein
MASNTEVHTLAPKMLGPTNPARTTRLFNAQLAIIDGRGETRPYLAEALPQLNTESWRVSPDGSMETTWKLRPSLTWHDGAPLTAEDIVFAWRVYSSPAMSVFKSTPQDLMDEVLAPDPRTVVIRWKQTFAEADAIILEDLDPLPRHLLEADFATIQDMPDTRDAFLGRRYWATEYIGSGPFRLTAWEPGSHLEGVAFDDHALGRPKIDRIVVRFIGDDNTVATNMLSEAIHLSFGQALRFEQAAFLEREWAASGRGRVLYVQTSTATLSVQLRPEYQQTPALRDVRVRRALVHTIDKQTVADALFEGRGRPADTYIGPEHPFYPEVDRLLAKYPYDPRQAEQLMGEVGFRRGSDGIYVNDAGERIAPGLWVTSGSQTERLLHILTDSGKRLGIDIQPHVIPNAQARDNQVRSTFPGLLNYGISPGYATSFDSFISRQIPSPETRWGGQNRGGWNHPPYDRAYDAFVSALDRGERVRRLAEVAQIISQEQPNIPVMMNLGAITHLSVLKGPEAGTPETTVHWNVHEWELQ